MIEELISMGFPREECLNAMRAAFNNPERAAEYLINVINKYILNRVSLLIYYIIQGHNNLKIFLQCPQVPK